MNDENKNKKTETGLNNEKLSTCFIMVERYSSVILWWLYNHRYYALLLAELNFLTQTLTCQQRLIFQSYSYTSNFPNWNKTKQKINLRTNSNSDKFGGEFWFEMRVVCLMCCLGNLVVHAGDRPEAAAKPATCLK